MPLTVRVHIYIVVSALLFVGCGGPRYSPNRVGYSRSADNRYEIWMEQTQKNQFQLLDERGLRIVASIEGKDVIVYDDSYGEWNLTYASTFWDKNLGFVMFGCNMFKKKPFVSQYEPNSHSLNFDLDESFALLDEKLQLTEKVSLRDQAVGSSQGPSGGAAARLKNFCASRTKPLDP